MIKKRLKAVIGLTALSLVALGLSLMISGSSAVGLKQTSPEPGSGGSIFGEKIGLPQNLPEGFVLYPNSTVLSSTSSEKNSQISLLTEENLEKVANYYYTHIDSTGWKEEGEGRYYRNGEKLEIEFLGDKDDKTIVIINYSLVPTR